RPHRARAAGRDDLRPGSGPRTGWAPRAIGSGRERRHRLTTILALETSCDETAAAVVDDGRHVRSSVVSSQVDLHARFGGVVPEIASRAHVGLIGPVIADALGEAGVELSEVDAVAACHGP